MDKQVRRGEIIYWHPRRGFGFFSVDGKKVFVHRSDLPDRIIPQVGQEFSFKVDEEGRAFSINRVAGQVRDNK